MEILSKSHGIHEIDPKKSHQIQWESYQNLMDTNGIFQIRSYQIQWESSQNLMDTNGICQIRSDPTQSSN